MIDTISRAIRREYYILFKQDYIKEQLKKRKGVCGMHGCCALYCHRKCIGADKKTCLKWDNLPYRCRIYPFDEKDKHPATRAYCNFYWENDETHNIRTKA